MHDVEWKPSATSNLAAICLEHPEHWIDIDAAEQAITYKLQRQPLQSSQEVSEGLRRIICWPLVVYFSIDRNQIEIDAVGWIG